VSIRIYSIGHGNRALEEFVEALKSNGTRQLVDVRSHPGSRHNPRFGREELDTR